MVPHLRATETVSTVVLETLEKPLLGEHRPNHRHFFAARQRRK
jgi:hypothetical protein